MKNKKSIGIIVGVLCLVCAIGLGIYFFYPRVDFVYIKEVVAFAEEGEGDYVHNLDLGESDKLDCGFEGVNVKGEKITWSSSDPAIVMIDDNGGITAVNVGETNVTCKVRDKEASLIVQVQGESNTSNAQIGYQFDADDKSYLFLDVGEKKHLDIYDASSMKKVNGNISFSVSDTSIASVTSSGDVEAKKVGSTILKAKINGISLKMQVVVRYSNSSNIYFLDVQDGNNAKRKYGNSFILQTIDGHYGMIDTGAYGNKKTDEISRQKGSKQFCNRVNNYLSSLGVKKLDFVVLSHMHFDHIDCFKELYNKVSIDNLYIKKYYSGSTDGIIKERADKSRELINFAKNKGTNIKYISDNENESFAFGEMSFWITNRNDVFAPYVTKCEKKVTTSNNKNKIGHSVCNENSNSLAILMSIKGKNRTSYTYFANDIENNSGLQYNRTINGVYVTKIFGNGNHYNGGDGVILYREDRSACNIRNHIVVNDNIVGQKVIDNCKKSGKEKRAQLKGKGKKGTFDSGESVDIDIYQVSHHGANNSITTYAYLKPKYVVFTTSDSSKSEAKSKFMRNVVGIKYDTEDSLTGTGTIIYSINTDGRVNGVIKMMDDDK